MMTASKDGIAAKAAPDWTTAIMWEPGYYEPDQHRYRDEQLDTLRSHIAELGETAGSAHHVLLCLHGGSTSLHQAQTDLVGLLASKTGGDVVPVMYTHQRNTEPYEALARLFESAGTAAHTELVSAVVRLILGRRARRSLMALAVLCQGYLALHLDEIRPGEFSRPDEEFWKNTLEPPLREAVARVAAPAEVRKKVDETDDWWLQGLGGNAALAKDEITRELGAEPAVDIVTLIQTVLGSAEAGVSFNRNAVVARGYVQLSRLLTK
jgi:hypothetical protein